MIVAYLFFVTLHATWTHSNFGPTIKWLEPYLIFPRFHHWHHTASPVDRNFAVHLPWIDWLFGTAYFPPGRWPDAYGIAGRPVPDGYWRQLIWPLRRQPARAS